MGCITGCLGELGLVLVVIHFLASMPWPLSEPWFWIVAFIGLTLGIGALRNARPSP